MSVQIFKPNIDVIRQQAQQAREAEQRRKEDSEFRWIDIVDGDNVFRLLPPTNSRGLILKRVANHYFRDTPFQGNLNKQRCLVETHDDVPGVTCPICEIGDRIKVMRPDIKIDRWHKPGISYYGQAIDRRDPTDTVPLARIVRVTPGVKNWIVQQVEQAWGQGIDITDFHQGLDINNVKGEKQTKGGKRTEYKPAIATLMGPTPLFSQLPAGVTLEQAIGVVVESMYDLDQIWKFPDDEGIAGINKAASDIFSYYQKEAYQQPGAQVQVPGTLASNPPQAVTPQTMPQAAQPQQVVQPQVAQPQPQVAQPAPQVAQPQPQAAQPQPQTPQQVASAAATIAQTPVQTQIPQTQPAQQAPAATQSTGPTDRPVCWGGAAQRPDGGTGYSDESEHCLMCPHELTCMDACSAGAA